ncbi:3-keto-disaccharide hydrolase [Flexithrix dorotheae]|uniref:3-keto-disaccharide hydrolase n=1 Tax=Flexithrix dorotheae TaxID=70993 RepID=UPI00035E17BB|nr:DUF1080 domain-containing protein [Flexithrix dorotheae]
MKKSRKVLNTLKWQWVFGFTIFYAQIGMSQNNISLDDLSFFKEPGKSWSIVGNVVADLQEDKTLEVSKGTGILVNNPSKKKKGLDLYSNEEFGDMDLELDFMMAKGSNSGIYLQGRYEVQLLDSWGVKNPKAGDNGGIYERWDESKPDGQKGYQGYAPRQNPSLAPGLWQHLKIRFQAPKFDESGKKIANARMLEIELNGVTIHEDVELFGPTRGPMAENEVSKGPLRIQGDHGPVAFRNIQITNYGKKNPTMSDLKYHVYEGVFEVEPDYASIEAKKSGETEKLTANVSHVKNNFLIKFNGKLSVPEADEFKFYINAPGGFGATKINGEKILSGKPISLDKGEHDLEIVYAKTVSWVPGSIGFALEGKGIRRFHFTEDNFNTNRTADPILVHAPETKILRSFVDVPEADRVVHAVSVGSPQKIHYTYDMDNGMIVQLWKGEFLDATPMWHSRGNGVSKPMGAVKFFGKPLPVVQKLASSATAFKQDTTGTGYKPKGYYLNEAGLPTFKYQIFDQTIHDEIRVSEDGKALKRNIKLESAGEGMYIQLASGDSIEDLSDGLYLVDDKSFYLRVDNASQVKPVIREINGKKELIAPVTNSLSYTILF